MSDIWVFVSPTRAHCGTGATREEVLRGFSAYDEDVFVDIEGANVTIGFVASTSEDNIPGTITVPREVLEHLLGYK